MDYLAILRALKAAYENLYIYFAVYAILVVALFIKGSKKEKFFFVFPVLVLTLTLFNPLLITPIMDDIGLAPRIRRIYWLLPVNVLLAYMAVKLVFLASRKFLRGLLTVLLCVCIALCGSSMVNSAMDKTENPYKLSEDIISIAESLPRNEMGEVKVAYTDPELLALREYDPAIKNCMTRKLMWTWKADITDPENLARIMEDNDPGKILSLVLRFGYTSFDMQVFRNALVTTGTRFVITKSQAERDAALEFSGCRLFQKTGEFNVYETRIDEFHDIASYYEDATYVILTRHGQTEGNKKGLYMGGSLDSPLTEEAIYQSTKLGENLHSAGGKVISAAYSSELDRAYLTAQNILIGMEEPDLPVEKVPGLNDIYWGDIEGKTKKEVKEAYGSTDLPVFMGSYDDKNFVSPAGGENLHDFYERFDQAMEDIASRDENKGQTVLVVAHSSAAEWAKIRFHRELDGLYHNGVSLLRYKDGDWTILSWNDMTFQ
ncbi:MAG: histidine phosphatase family protein [Lachnospiraceae bacterium]|nr:histidine phosphatase family protein [Lachnospiraceae bacterium]